MGPPSLIEKNKGGNHQRERERERERERDKEKKGTKNKKREERYKFLRTMEEISMVIRPKCCDIL